MNFRSGSVAKRKGKVYQLKLRTKLPLKKVTEEKEEKLKTKHKNKEIQEGSGAEVFGWVGMGSDGWNREDVCVAGWISVLHFRFVLHNT